MLGTREEAVELLAARAIGGDRAAFGALAERFAAPLAAFASRRLEDPTEATDVAQATLVRALESIGSLREPGAARGWLYGIALNECRRRRRGLGRLKAAYERWREGRVLAQRAAEAPLEADEAGRVRAAIATLPEKQRLAVELRVFDGLSVDEAATALGCTPGTIKANFHHALVKLRAILGDDHAL